MSEAIYRKYKINRVKVLKIMYLLLDMGDSVLENILEVNSGMEAGRTYMYLVHSEKVP